MRGLLQSDWELPAPDGQSIGSLELLIPDGNAIRHYFMNPAQDPGLMIAGPNVPWSVGNPIAYFDQTIPKSVACIQSNFKGDGTHGNLEAIVRVSGPQGQDSLDFWYLDSSGGQGGPWSGPFPLMVDGSAVTGVTGNPALIQSTWGAKGNFELLVPHGHAINHYYRDNDSPGFPWHLAQQLSYPAVGSHHIGPFPLGVTFIQSDFMADGFHGNFEAIVRVAPPFRGDRLDFWYFDSAAAKWHGAFPVMVDRQEVDGVTGDPSLYSWPFRTCPFRPFELLVPCGRVIQQYERDNCVPSLPWRKAGKITYPPVAPGTLASAVRDVDYIVARSLLSSPIGSIHSLTNGVAIVRLSPPPVVGEPDHFHYWSELNPDYKGPVPLILTDGKLITATNL